MPDPAPPANPGAAQEQRNEGFLSKYGGTLFRTLLMWLAMQYFMGSKTKVTTPQEQQPATTGVYEASEQEGIVGAGESATQVEYFPVLPTGVYHNPYPPQIPVSRLPTSAVPLWSNNVPVELDIYVNENEYFVDYNAKPSWHQSDIMLGDAMESREHHIEIPTTSNLQHNGSLYAHIFVTKAGAPIDPNNPSFSPDSLVYYRHQLTKFYPKKTTVKQKKLLDLGNDDVVEEEEEVEQEEFIEQTTTEDGSTGGASILDTFTRRAPLVAYWHENMTISIINDPKSPIAKNAMQPATMKYIPFNTGLHRDATGKIGFYRPIVFPNEFWHLRSNAYAINETVSVLPLTIHLEPLTMWKFNMYAMFDESMKQQANSPMGGMSSSEMDELKRTLMETNPYLLATTAAVSLLHSAFEFLAFKNDIAFWKKKNNSTGVSVRSLITNIFFQVVIFLYLMDNNQETSWMILFSQGIGLVIEVWKVFKALKYELVWKPGSLLPSIGSQDTETTDTEDETAEYDAIAFKYLRWIAYPLLGGYAVYSLLYDEHKSWYSYVLKTLVEFVYMFGFITMMPQLYINYRLKSVAHMPWRTLMYKSLNTFIDDLFAFVIKMPTLHRLACLRDDVVFFVYLYQRYKYKVDPTRANEFGQVGDASASADAAEKKEGGEEKEKEESKKTK
ncbi:cleft lip and palate transmembrane protein 1-domain-containing protein [Zychaea mexicana]|uniref:cleft lip and palate transmembrane protein 1-domain-containing protein n=1 Tax=Zychaea mexicana TaxID=64656 RepID=UPI0022FDD1CB|nr:cleft lip and palate transmembrane protein 1-domain-containing protein [Zychaea mexicana]KAI9470455.1 cleft lip and palate transmembrane protein 1-domain-containing protein [Zychaea mexicana]